VGLVHRFRGRVHLLALLAVSLGTTSALAQEAESSRDTLAYTTTIVTVRAKPLASAQSLGRLDAGVVVRLYSCSEG